MAGHTLILNLLGGVALLVWATQMVRKGVMRAFGARLRQAIGRATSGRMRACGAGLGVATALQSSSATGLLVVAFAERGIIALAPALAVMLGADIGSTLVVQALSLQDCRACPGSAAPRRRRPRARRSRASGSRSAASSSVLR